MSITSNVGRIRLPHTIPERHGSFLAQGISSINVKIDLAEELMSWGSIGKVTFSLAPAERDRDCGRSWYENERQLSGWAGWKN